MTLERNEVGPRVRAWTNKEGYDRVKVILTQDVDDARQER